MPPSKSRLLSIGSTVMSRQGEFLPKEAGRTKRIQAFVEGVVVQSLPGSQWRVYWTSIDRTSDCPRGSLIYKGPRDRSMSDEDLATLNDPRKLIAGGPAFLQKYLKEVLSGANSNNSLSTSIRTATSTSTTAVNISELRPNNEVDELRTHNQTAQRIIAENLAARAVASVSTAANGTEASAFTEDRSQVLLGPSPGTSNNPSDRTDASGFTEDRSQVVLGPSPDTADNPSDGTDASGFTEDRSQVLLGPSTCTTNNPSEATDASMTTENRSEVLLSTGAASGHNPPGNSNVSGAVQDSDETVTEEDDADGNNPQYVRELWDPIEIIEDILENGDQHARNWATYLKEKEKLISEKKTVQCGKYENVPVVWTVCDDVKKDTLPDDISFNATIGVRDFDFSDKTEKTGCKRNEKAGIEENKNERINFSKLLLHLWPGTLIHQLRKVNKLIRFHNEHRMPHERSVKQISKNEYLRFLGIMLLPRVEGVKGGCLWTDAGKGEGIRKLEPIAQQYMKQYRFQQIQKYVPFLWASEDLKEAGDPWWQIADVGRLFTENRQRTVLASNMKTGDETMSPLKPRTTKTGNLQHLSFILRKPKPLGTEFKTIACAYLKIMLGLEICRGKDDVFGNELLPELRKKTTACSVRLMRMANQRSEFRQLVRDAGSSWNEHDWPRNQEPTDDTFVADSWFGSVTTALSMRNELVMEDKANSILQIKTATSNYPKKFLDDTMKDWPGGSHIVLTATVGNEKLYAVGYKYCKKKNLCFVFNEGASHTEPGEPYVARWKDENGNEQFREVPRPACCARYFIHSNCIDVHNQLRQDDLALEEHWITQDGYFRIFTTVFGICVTDAYLAYKHHLHRKHRHKEVPMKEFASILALDLLNNTEDNGVVIDREDGAWNIGKVQRREEEKEDGNVFNRVVTLNPNDSQTSIVSQLTSPSFASPPAAGKTGYCVVRDMDDLYAMEAGKHYLIKTTETVSCTRKRKNATRSNTDIEYEAKRTKRCLCRDCWTMKKRDRRTSMYCAECKPPVGCQRYWLCEECHPVHRETVKEEMMKRGRLG